MKRRWPFAAICAASRFWCGSPWRVNTSALGASVLSSAARQACADAATAYAEANFERAASLYQGALDERVDTETWVEIMNRVFHLLGDAIYCYGGEVDQYRGDGLVAFFGVSAVHENDPERALRAALDMTMALEQFNIEYADQLPQPLALHFGLNSGLVIAGGIGAGHILGSA